MAQGEESVSGMCRKRVLSLWWDKTFLEIGAGLQTWLFDKNNPLTARVFVN